MMTETAAEQRQRILTDEELDADTFDLIASLGYEPESWDGMWKLVSDPIRFRDFGIVAVREVIYHPGTHNAVILGTDANPRVKTRLVIRRDPEHKGKLATLLGLTASACCFAFAGWAYITATAAW